ncbi:hypothetical protein ACISRB_27785, partial [Micromonospora aurantiaca]
MTTTLPTFAATGLAPALVSELAAQGISAPFPIQAATIPDSLAGRDVLDVADVTTYTPPADGFDLVL